MAAASQACAETHPRSDSCTAALGQSLEAPTAHPQRPDPCLSCESRTQQHGGCHHRREKKRYLCACVFTNPPACSKRSGVRPHVQSIRPPFPGALPCVLLHSAASLACQTSTHPDTREQVYACSNAPLCMCTAETCLLPCHETGWGWRRTMQGSNAVPMPSGQCACHTGACMAARGVRPADWPPQCARQVPSLLFPLA